jgi:hypothetical protein
VNQIRFSTTLAAAVAVLTVLGTAEAEVSRAVQQAFRGQILVTAGELPGEAGDDKATVAAYKKAVQRALPRADMGGLPSWSFHYTAFLNRAPGVSELSLDFYTDDKERRYVANKRLMGIDPKLPILKGRMSITEDDGLLPGRSYVMKLAGTIRGKEVVFAETTVSTR